MRNLYNLIILILATFRLTELFVKDNGPYDVFKKIRIGAGKRANKNSHYRTLADALNCAFCFGIWASIIIMLCPKFIKTILAVAGGQALLEYLISRGNDE